MENVKDGMRLPTDFSRTTLPAPKAPKSPHIEGPGWTIDLASGWSVNPAAEPGNFTLKP